MLTPSFSTVACSEWTLERVASAADEYGFEGVELRSFLDAGGCAMACDPSLTDTAKARAVFEAEGVEIVGVASSVKFDDQILPPVIGRAITDTEKQIRQGKRYVSLAAELHAPFVRVFGFDTPFGERREMVIRRIVERLKYVADDARHTGVRVALENGGGFLTASDLREIIDRVGSPLCGACYSLAAGVDGGDSVDEAIETLGDDLLMVRLKDLKDGKPCLLGEGELPCDGFVRALVRSGFDGPLVYEWDRLWLSDLASPEEALPHAAKTIFGWMPASAPSPAMT